VPRLSALAALIAFCSPAAAEPVVTSAASGPWSADSTWAGGKPPAAGDRVLVKAGHRVVYDVASDAVIRGVTISGVLSFAPDRDTRLNVGLIVIQPGNGYTEEGFDCEAHVAEPDPHAPRPALEVGTPDRPIGDGKSAVIRLHFVPG